ncbi:hypothetical protein MmarC5_1746 [Methanococcus maripaludis C5]|uniref:Uncharacterized protein n=1 Tax=Methanococcus maripaludis (strain C5 / ATCC BAA-1333) TaxID=402880 RepID=A4G0Q9_METM5|nr:hypothetical protein [Methanococcus maripaludis]ABO36043.1 hypothetical protein MmarC5_1746 [Methanococcus maripaludis C5]
MYEEGKEILENLRNRNFEYISEGELDQIFDDAKLDYDLDTGNMLQGTRDIGEDREFELELEALRLEKLSILRETKNKNNTLKLKIVSKPMTKLFEAISKFLDKFPKF